MKKRKAKTRVLIAIIIIIILSITSYFIFRPSALESPPSELIYPSYVQYIVSTPGCVDTDKGIVPNLKGNSYSESGKIYMSDKCSSPFVLKEAYCAKSGSNYIPAYADITCSYGCNATKSICKEATDEKIKCKDDSSCPQSSNITYFCKQSYSCSTKTICMNPDTIASYCVYNKCDYCPSGCKDGNCIIVCSSDSQCPQPTNTSAWCEINGTKTQTCTRINRCNNPATPSSNCNQYYSCKECPQSCLNGVCISKVN